MTDYSLTDANIRLKEHAIAYNLKPLKATAVLCVASNKCLRWKYERIKCKRSYDMAEQSPKGWWLQYLVMTVATCICAP